MVAVLFWWPLDGCCSFLVASGWLLFFPGGLWMVAVISWWPLDGCCYFLVASGWLLLFPGSLWMVAVICTKQSASIETQIHINHSLWSLLAEMCNDPLQKVTLAPAHVQRMTTANRPQFLDSPFMDGTLRNRLADSTVHTILKIQIR